VTKAEIEADIAALLRVAVEAYVSETECQAAGRAASRLREMLSKLDGPAEGYERVWLKVRERRIQGGLEAFVFQSEHDAKKYVSDRESLAIVVADIPKRVVPVVIGEVSK
jgi:hypothetical protein